MTSIAYQLGQAGMRGMRWLRRWTIAASPAAQREARLFCTILGMAVVFVLVEGLIVLLTLFYLI